MRTVRVVIDRPLGSRHPEHPDIVYPVNYGYIPSLPAGDGEDQDVYVLGVQEPLKAFEGEIIAIIRRKDDDEDKWVAAPRWTRFTREEIKKATDFVERYFESSIELLNPPFESLPVNDLKTGEITLRLREIMQGDPEKEWVPGYRFDICLPDGTKAGVCDLRIGHSTRVYYGGNIGYAVDENYRGHHYAAKACRLLLQLARAHDMEYLYITCNPGNRASARTIALAGGQYIETAYLPQEHDLYRRGERQAMIYRFDL